RNVTGVQTCALPISVGLEEVGGDAKLAAVGADVGERRLDGLLHHFAELAGLLEHVPVVGTTPRHPGGFDLDQIAAYLGDGEAVEIGRASCRESGGMA